MRINSLNSFTCINSVNFRQGLTPEIVNHVKNMDKEEYRNITERVWKKYGIISHVGASNTVAFCLEKTAEIMSRAGFKLPKVFLFEKLNNGYYGEYNQNNVVSINSDRQEFLDLEEQDKMEESISGNSPFKNHFLDTYIHEFLHAAHCENIMNLHGGNVVKGIFFGEMAAISPNNFIKEPLTAFIKKFRFGSYNELESAVFSCHGDIFCTDNLAEYFAEKNTIIISKKLGNNLNIDSIDKNISSCYEGFPQDWHIKNQKKYLKKLKFDSNYKKSKSQEQIIKLLSDIIKYFDGEVWNGNIDNIVNNSRAIRNYNVNYANK